ncbi:MAG: aminotransferase class V-fold PLP-dependent enzyme [Planctomycetota bacterium]
MDLAAHWGLEEGVRYLNHGSFGACPRPVLARQRELRDEFEANGTRFLGRELLGRLAVAREVLAAFVGADPADLVFVRNATMGVNAVLRSLPLGTDDELLTTDMEYGASRNVLDFVAARAGARVRVAHVPFPLEAEDEVLGALHAAVSARTRLLLIDHITSATGLVLPLARIVAEMRERGVETVVDGAHGPGQVELRLDELGALAYTGNCHKWLCSPKGSALLWVRRDWQERIRPTSISHGATARLTPGRSRFLEEFEWLGTDDPSPALCVPDAIAFLRGLFPDGFAGLRRHNKALVLEGRRLLCEALGIPAPAPEAMIAALASVPLPDLPPAEAEGALRPEALMAWLNTRGFEVVGQCWPATPRCVLRVSAQAYNRPEEYADLAGAVAEFFAGRR